MPRLSVWHLVKGLEFLSKERRRGGKKFKKSKIPMNFGLGILWDFSYASGFNLLRMGRLRLGVIKKHLS